MLLPSGTGNSNHLRLTITAASASERCSYTHRPTHSGSKLRVIPHEPLVEITTVSTSTMFSN